MTENSKDAWALVMAALCWCGLALMVAGVIIALGHAPLSARVLVGVGAVIAVGGGFLCLSIRSQPVKR